MPLTIKITENVILYVVSHSVFLFKSLKLEQVAALVTLKEQ